MSPKGICAAALTWACSLCIAPTLAHAQTPNIVVILADDFGVGDIQAHYPDHPIATPSLDRLVAEGISFADAHSASSVCSPTRYGLLTGRYCWRTRLQEWVIAAYEPPLIAPDRLTLPAYLQQHGYDTACIGKWHLGWDWPGPQRPQMTESRNGQARMSWDFTQPVGGGPIDRGFDRYFGVDLPNLPPFTFIDGDRVVEAPTDVYRLDPSEGEVLPRGFVGAPMAPGWRLDRILPTITDHAVRYIHDRATEDSPFFLFFSMTSPHEPVVPSDRFDGRSGISPIADFVMETDWSAGQLLDAIDEAGIAEETIVIFTADNGHSHYTGWNSLVEAGQMPSGPYRGHKGDIWEGGHRVPMIIRWPGRIHPGATSDQLVCLNDLFATCAELLSDPLPENAAEDSFSFLSSALHPGQTSERTSVVHHSRDGEFAYREGPWKLVFSLAGDNLNDSRGLQCVVGLYNLAGDIAETRDLALEHPDVVARLTANLQRTIDRGTSRPGPAQDNDAPVRFDVTQTIRWTID